MAAKRRPSTLVKVLQQLGMFALVAMSLPAMSAFAEGGRNDVPWYTYVGLGGLLIVAVRAAGRYHDRNARAYYAEQSALGREAQEALDGAHRRQRERLLRTVSHLDDGEAPL